MSVDARPVSETDKSRLVDHLRDVVIQGLSGRDQADLVDVVPSRAIFAGVLQPPRPSTTGAAMTGAPPDTAIGIDLRLRPVSGDVRIVVRARWSQYYAVFPTYAQAVEVNPPPGKIQSALPQPATSSVPVAAALPDRSSTQLTDGDESASSDEAPESDEIDPGQPRGRVVLPRVFRRLETKPISLPVLLKYSAEPSNVTLGAQQFADAIAEARETIASDPQVWRHLGDPTMGERSLGDRAVLRTQRAYDEALAAVAGFSVEPPAWSLSLQAEAERDASIEGVLRVRVLLANQTIPTEGTDLGLQDASIFDAGLEIQIESGEVVPFEFLLAPKDYRSDPRMIARGINCSVASDDSGQFITTETLPVYKQPLFRTREELKVGFDDLDCEDATSTLDRVSGAMNDYLAQWDTFLSTEAPSRFSPREIEACAADRKGFAEETERFQLGVDCLRQDLRLALAFRLMNRVFSRLATRSGGRVSAWRLFQIGFIVSQLPALAAREIDPESRDPLAERINEVFTEVGVLWFPTGGGKTEAYLGLIATTLRVRPPSRQATWRVGLDALPIENAVTSAA